MRWYLFVHLRRSSTSHAVLYLKVALRQSLAVVHQKVLPLGNVSNCRPATHNCQRLTLGLFRLARLLLNGASAVSGHCHRNAEITAPTPLPRLLCFCRLKAPPLANLSDLA